ncbi:hypothetical protein [Bosea sp. TAF32]|uniref:hypothetical protein n=1 Tax=Bosea sp. TAF32 TaxID=3237482 RepID=UPI003F918B25
MLCARAFGACIMMRDEPLSTPIPEKLEPSTQLYDERIAATEKRIAELTAMTADGALTASLAANNELARQRREHEAEDQARLERHLVMAERVRGWDAPKSHAALKQFMLEQLAESMRFIGGSYPLPPMKIGEAWRQEQLSDLSDSLARSRKSHAEEIQRTAERQQWLDDLRAALPPAAGDVGGGQA